MSNIELSQAERLDQYVVRHFPDLSRAFASKLIERGEVLVNGTVEHKAGYKLRPSDNVTITYDPADTPPIPSISLEVLYEDDDCVVINKPEGLLTHSKGAFNPEATVATWLRDHISDGALKVNDRAGIVHRLDRATSGVMICAKTADALSWLQKQFSQRRVKKTYSAVVTGTLKQPEALIDMPIERNPKKPQTFRVGSNGKTSQTTYRVVDADGTYSLLELKPTTGRTHQLRVHLDEIGHPIVGDPLYGGEAADRLYLHAHSLELTLPNRNRQTFTVPIPEAFQEKLHNDA